MAPDGADAGQALGPVAFLLAAVLVLALVAAACAAGKNGRRAAFAGCHQLAPAPASAIRTCRPPPAQTADLRPGNPQKLVTVGCVKLEAGGVGASCARIAPRPLPVLNWTVPPSAYQRRPQVQVGDDYVQVWSYFDGGGGHLPTKNSDPDAGKLPGTNKRSVAIAHPAGDPPAAGWPFVFMFEFMTEDGMSVGWTDGGNEMQGGVAEVQMGGGLIVDDAASGAWSFVLYKRHLVRAGYALVMLSELMYDTEMNLTCGDTTDVQSACWNRGENVDADALRRLFDRIRTNSSALWAAEWGRLGRGKQRLDYGRCAVAGYSVGAATAARLCDEFPRLRTLSGAPFPKIRAAVLLAGGSFFCYDYPGGEHDGPKKVPAAFYPCGAPDIGCCPTHCANINFAGGRPPWGQYPPTLLLQSEQDVYASWEATSKLFALLVGKGVPTYRAVAPTLPPNREKGPPGSGEGSPPGARGRHGIYACQIPVVLGFLRAYL